MDGPAMGRLSPVRYVAVNIQPICKFPTSDDANALRMRATYYVLPSHVLMYVGMYVCMWARWVALCSSE